MALIGYVRCSTDKQMVLQQIDALRAAGCKTIYKDKAVNATAKNRPGLASVRQTLRRGDTFVVTAIDRAFRSTLEAILFLDDVLKPNKITFRSLRERIDTSTPEGRKWYIREAAEAECEREKISIRTREAMQAMKRRGRKFGRPAALTRKQLAFVRNELRHGSTKKIRQVARRVRVCPRTVSRALAPGYVARKRKPARRKRASRR